jgi:hypothetical protein
VLKAVPKVARKVVQKDIPRAAQMLALMATPQAVLTAAPWVVLKAVQTVVLTAVQKAALKAVTNEDQVINNVIHFDLCFPVLSS